MDFPLMTSFPFELAMSRIILEHVDHVVKVNERVTDGDNIHFARVNGSPSDQVPKGPNPFTPIFTIVSQN